jgi:hypothetical protein
VITPELVDRAIVQMRKSAEHFAYFFDRLSSPEWIGPLVEAGLFDEPPVLQVQDGYVTAPPWPPSRYLARMAEAAPDEVLAVILRTSTNNERVHQDFAEAAISMPPPEAVRVAEYEIEYLAGCDRLYFLLSDKLVELVGYLAAAGDVDIALRLATELLRLGAYVEDGTAGRSRIRTRLADWDYAQSAQKISELLLPHAPLRTLELFSDLLSQALSIEHETPDDLSDMWLRRLDVIDRARPDASLAGVLLNGAKQAVSEGLLSLDRVSEVLRGTEWRLGRRILWLTTSEAEEPQAAALGRAILDRDELSRSDPSSEYQAMVRRHFPRLSLEDQERFLAWVDAGPTEVDVARWRDWTLEHDGEDRSAEFVAIWKLRRFGLIRASLTGRWREEYERLVDEFGEREFDARFEVRSWVGPTSPLTHVQLQELPNDELIAYLDNWEPSRDWAAPSVEGLARAVGDLAAAEPMRLSRIARDFADLSPSYASSLIAGLIRAIREGAELDWDAILDLCEALSARSRAALLEAASSDSWFAPESLRIELASLLSAGFETDSPIPQSLREPVFALIRELLSDPDPTDDAERREEQFDPSTRSLNSVRGQAFHAAMRYGLWVRRELERQAGAAYEVRPSFDAIPELRDVLEQHLVVEQDASLAIRSAYGQWYPWLVLLDPEWAEAHIDAIFPLDQQQVDYWWAAWGSYVTLNPVYDSVAETLESRYRHAISLVNTTDPVPRWLGSVETVHQHLVDHLMILLWRGHLPDVILHEFYSEADVALRKHALEVLGRGLHEVGEDLDGETRDRVCALLEQRVAAVSGSARDERGELAALGWWLQSEAIATEWKLTQLDAALSLNVLPEPESEAFEFLAAAASEYPLVAMAALAKLVESTERPLWSIAGNSDAIQRALRAGLESADQEAQQVAADVVHRLGRLGYREYRDLFTGVS